MIRFLLKGIIRDRSRSLFPILTVLVGTALTVLFYGYISGVLPDIIELNAHLDLGHIKVMTQAYHENINQQPLDLALEDADILRKNLESDFPDMIWQPRIRFGGLMDIADENGDTRAQATIFGLAVDLITADSPEIEFLNLNQALVPGGKIPQLPEEILIGETRAEKFQLQINDDITFIGSNMDGAMCFYNFKIAGMLNFGIAALDKGGAIIADIHGVQDALNMEGASTEILGFFKDGEYSMQRATEVRDYITNKYTNAEDPYSPIATRLIDHLDMESYFKLIGAFMAILSFVFILAMFIVLWNSGLMNGLRRYGEMGLRLAIGEEKGHIYRTLLMESGFTGIIGTILGTGLGLAGTWYLQEYGIDIGYMAGNSAMYMSNIIRAKITTGCFYIGFIPGLIAPVLGSLVSGRGIYRRQTAQLFKELEI